MQFYSFPVKQTASLLSANISIYERKCNIKKKHSANKFAHSYTWLNESFRHATILLYWEFFFVFSVLGEDRNTVCYTKFWKKVFLWCLSVMFRQMFTGEWCTTHWSEYVIIILHTQFHTRIHHLTLCRKKKTTLPWKPLANRCLAFAFTQALNVAAPLKSPNSSIPSAWCNVTKLLSHIN